MDTFSESGLGHEMPRVNGEKEVGAAIGHGRITVERVHIHAYGAVRKAAAEKINDKSEPEALRTGSG